MTCDHNLKEEREWGIEIHEDADSYPVATYLFVGREKTGYEKGLRRAGCHGTNDNPLVFVC